jgi:hypothetical protein
LSKKGNMITEITNLIQHNYDYDAISSNISTNCLKQIDIWNKDDNINNPYAKEILNNDLVLSIEDLNEPYEVYAYSFFKVHKSELGNNAYQLTKIVLDSEMSDDFIKYCISSILKNLLNGDDTIKDRVIVNDNNYPLVSYSFKETEQKVIKEILDEFHFEKNDMTLNERLNDLVRKICHKK